MPTSFDVTSSTGRYPVHIAPGLLGETLAEPGERLFLVDAFLADTARAAGVDAVAIPADERTKSLDRMTDLIVTLRDRRVTRATELIAIGGGVVQDVAAFAASIYMRGLAWSYLPTTLLSMTDSCIGGKSSINVGPYKNIVGTFHPPRRVLIDPVLTQTLSPEQRAAGLCEAAKICLARGPEALDRYLALAPSVHSDAGALAAVMDESLRAKTWFIEIDEFDRNERLLLNFGHTFGHALEAASGFAIGHGIAVGLGMLAAIRLGEALGRDYGGLPHIQRFRTHIDALVATASEVPDVLARLNMPSLMDAFASDKKHGRDRFAVITADAGGRLVREFLPRDAASSAKIERAYTAMIAGQTSVRAG